WTLCYQSQFGYDKWLMPATQVLLTELPKRGMNNVDIVCPGFSVDCLETLEEIAITGKKLFLKSGGNSLRYIPALNDSDEQIKLLISLIS
ncbi:MAG: ferrochelatase, partial [uncultured bacterium]